MNKNFYKTIFSKTRGEMIAVAENVSAAGQSENGSGEKARQETITVSTRTARLKTLALSMMLFTGMALLLTTTVDTQANIVADPNAAGNQRPTILNSANGTIQVNIQTPTQAGVSVNHYQQFDVNQNGVVLNNSYRNTQTQLAGYIQANPWLAAGEAKVIVNQINSTQASHLNGYVEVAGRKADVIIANQAGIKVDGGGFINAGGVTLSTANPLLNNGGLNGFQIRDGIISITGQGLDAGTTDYTRLLAHTAQINAGVWAKDLSVVTGRSDIAADNTISHQENAAATAKPQFAIDTGRLGGMYAGKISLISNDRGVGINNAGQIFATAGSVQISADGKLQNSGSVVAQHKENAAQATLDIQSNSLDNSGSISSLGKQNIQTNSFKNTGLIATANELNIRNSTTLHNQGELNAGRFDIESQVLNNQTGKIVQTGLQDLAIDTQTLFNSQNSLIGYTEVDNTTGGNTGGGTGSETGNTGSSEAPTTATGGGGTHTAKLPTISNFTQGKIKASNVNNDAGQITANGGVHLSTTQSLDNAGSLNLKSLKAEGNLLKNQESISAAILDAKVTELDNHQAKIYSHTATVATNKLNNQSGEIQAAHTLDLKIKDQLNNQAGLITAVTAINVHDANQNTLTVDNTQAGKILSVGDLKIQSKALLHAGQSELIANQDIHLKQQQQLNIDSVVQAGRKLTIENDADVVNNSLLEAGSQLKIAAQNIQNTAQAKIQANDQVDLSAQNDIHNTGLINSQGQTLIEAKNTINNIGTGQIYGDHIALAAQKLVNAEQATDTGLKAGTIAARKRLDIGVQQLENREQALLSSENQLAIGGQLNKDHLAEGSAQHVDNASARIQSVGDMWITTKALSNRNLHFSSSEKEVPGTRKYIVEYVPDVDPSLLFDQSEILEIGKYETIYVVGDSYEDYTKFEYTRYEKQDYVDSSAPAYIVSGGNLTLDGENLVNDKSQILAANGISIKNKEVDSLDADGTHRVIQTGNSEHHIVYYDWKNNKKGKWENGQKYNPADITTPIKLGVVKYDGSYQGPNAGLNPTQIQTVKTENVDDKTKTEIRTITPDLSLPNQSLYSINKDNNNNPLIETNAAFTNYKKWLGSDYMLKMLSTDPQNMHKRLGDGYYEQKLVNDQIAQLTGRVYLDGYSNYEDQFKGLMDAGISAAQTFKLTPGMALSEAQIARLTSDIVWLVTETVTLDDGQKVQVLVPKVYALVQAGDLNGQGTLIAADTINMQLKGNLNNSGTIAGRRLVNLTGDNINNVGGLIQGANVFAQASQDVNNIGGQFKAEQKLVLDAGNNINNLTTTNKTENKIGQSEFAAENIGRVAGLYVMGKDGQLLAQAKNDINLKAADIKSAGSVTLNAGNDLNLSTVNVSRKDLSSAGQDNFVLRSSSKDVGSAIQADGNISLKSTGNTSITAGTIDSQYGTVVVSAGKDIQLNNGSATTTATVHSTEKGALGSSAKKQQQRSSEQSIATNIHAGKDILIDSRDGNIDAKHLIADAKGSIQIEAEKGHVNLLSAIDEKSGSSITNKKNAIAYNNRQSGFIDQELAQTQLTAGKTVDINAGKTIELQANDIKAGESIYVGNTLLQRQADGTLKSADGSLMPENVTLSTVETHDQQWDEQQKGYRGIAKELMKTVAIGLAGVEGLAPGLKANKMTIGESSSHRTEQVKQTGSNLTADQVYVGSAGQTTLTSSNIDANKVVLSGHKVTLNAAEEQNIVVDAKGKETVQGLGVKLNKDNIRLGGFVTEDQSQSTKTVEISHKAGNLNTKDLTIQGANGIDILGQNINATGDTVLDHGRGNLNIGGYENKTTAEEKTHTETISAEVGVRNAYLDAALALVAVKDAASALKQAKEDYSQAQRDYAAGKITKGALDDTKANLAMATANVASAEIAMAAAAAGAAASSGTYGFTIGANGERIETETSTHTVNGQWQGSQLELNNLTLKSEGKDANIQGSRVKATGVTTFDGTHDLNVIAGTEHRQQESSSKTNNQKVSYTYGGGGSASVGKQSSQSKSEGLTHVNSQVELNQVSGSLNKLNIQGGNVSIADRGDLKVKEIHVESLQDTASSSSSSKGGSIGAGFGSSGAVTSGSASYNQAKGKSESAWVNDTSSLLIGNAKNDADLDAMGVQKVTNIGGVIANATQNADGTLTDHGKLNYSGALELQDIQDHRSESNKGFNISTSIGKPQPGKDANSAKFPSGSTTIGMQNLGNEQDQLTKATMGQGTVKNATDSTHRDINNTQEITRDQVTGLLDGSVTVDHRLLTESGRKEIVQEQKDIAKNTEVIGKMTVAGVTSLGVAAVGVASGDQNLKQAYQTLMNPANTFDFVQKHPEAAAILNKFKNGEFEDIESTKIAMNELAQILGVNIEVLTTNITEVYGLKGTTNKEIIAIDVNGDNRKDSVEVLGHEVAHNQGLSNETLTGLSGKATDLGFSSGITYNKDNVDYYQKQIGDGKDLQTQKNNEVILSKDNQSFFDEMNQNPNSFENYTTTNNAVHFYEKINIALKNKNPQEAKKLLDTYSTYMTAMYNNYKNGVANKGFNKKVNIYLDALGTKSGNRIILSGPQLNALFNMFPKGSAEYNTVQKLVKMQDEVYKEYSGDLHFSDTMQTYNSVYLYPNDRGYGNLPESYKAQGIKSDKAYIDKLKLDEARGAVAVLAMQNNALAATGYLGAKVSGADQETQDNAAIIGGLLGNGLGAASAMKKGTGSALNGSVFEVRKGSYTNEIIKINEAQKKEVEELVRKNAYTANAQAALKAKYSGLQNAQKTAVRTSALPDGRIRYYDKEVLARTKGPTRGAAFVTEFDPKTGSVKQWMENYGHNGNVIRVHPKSINGQPVSGQHYPPTGSEIKLGAK